jgi:uncharacterized protein YceH (UPF0502 family)
VARESTSNGARRLADSGETQVNSGEAKWQPLTALQRRIVGVLVEKAKTTPEQYPLSLNGLTTGCNQKSNRFPLMNVEAEDVQVELDVLRNLGAVVEVQSGGRVPKYKHLMYEWLGVDKLELAVMAELLLRGAQTVGELRARAARMEPIPDLQSLRPILRSLIDKGLVIELTPEGRGQTVTHGLLSESEVATARGQAAAGHYMEEEAPRKQPSSPPPASDIEQKIRDLQRQLDELDGRVHQLERQGTHE